MIEPPMWFRQLPNTAILSAKDIYDMFGYANSSSLTNAANRSHSFPKADVDRKNFKPSRGIGTVTPNPTKSMWTKSTVMQEINRRNSICKN